MERRADGWRGVYLRTSTLPMKIIVSVPPGFREKLRKLTWVQPKG